MTQSFYTYESLWKVYDNGAGEQSLRSASDEEAQRMIYALVNTDEAWKEVNCMGLLRCIRPRLHKFIASWTGGHFKAIRECQESGETSELLKDFLEDMRLLPSYPFGFVHYSKDSSWVGRYPVGSTLEIKSFMGCAAQGSSFVHAKDPRIFFQASSQVRYLGSLTTTPPEREVIVMSGASFKVIHSEGGAIYVEDLC